MKCSPVRLAASIFAIFLVIGSTGCSRNQDLEIRKYSIPKSDEIHQANHVQGNKPDHLVGSPDSGTPRVAPKGKKQRMIAAIAPVGDSMLFFKLTVPDEKTGELPLKFAELLASMTIDGGTPTWKLPKGWRQLPDDSPRNASGGFRRLATILVDPSDKSLELAVSRLTDPEGDTPKFILRNVNRWRRQLGIPPVTPKNLYTDPKDTEATQEVRQRKFNGRTVVLVNLVGFKGSSGMGRPPFLR